MRKLIITLMIMTLFTFVACSPSHLKAENISNNTRVIISTTEPISLDTSSENIPTDIKDNRYRANYTISSDAVTFDLKNTNYNVAGEIVVDGNIINVSDHSAGVIRLVKLELYNENDELIASNAFGYMPKGTRIQSGDEMAFSFTFPAITVFIRDDDLDSVKSISKYSTKH